MAEDTAGTTAVTHIYALINYEDAYVQPLILAALKDRLPKSSYTLISTLSDRPDSQCPTLQWQAYESLDFESSLENPQNQINSYIIRKALIRKHYLSNTTATWVTKYPDSKLKLHVKPSVEFELDYAEFLDDALIEAFELRESFERNEGKDPRNREWWILKPGMSDRGQGIRLFSSEEELQAIFEEWEADAPDSDEEAERSDAEMDGNNTQPGAKNDYIITSQLRHFVAQPYIHPPLLINLPGSSTAPRKFHIRTYVLAVGALRVYVFKPMLALFAAREYFPPYELSSLDDLRAHLTNTCLQETGEREGSVAAFWSLPDELTGISPSKGWKEKVWDQICFITGEVFEAAAKSMSVHFQTLPQAFEIFGLDFLVDDRQTVSFLEVNAFPDFRQTGDELKVIIQELFQEVVETAIKPFFGLVNDETRESDRIVKVCDIDLGRR